MPALNGSLSCHLSWSWLVGSWAFCLDEVYEKAFHLTLSSPVCVSGKCEQPRVFYINSNIALNWDLAFTVKKLKYHLQWRVQKVNGSKTIARCQGKTVPRALLGSTLIFFLRKKKKNPNTVHNISTTKYWRREVAGAGDSRILGRKVGILLHCRWMAQVINGRLLITKDSFRTQWNDTPSRSFSLNLPFCLPYSLRNATT